MEKDRGYTWHTLQWRYATIVSKEQLDRENSLEFAACTPRAVDANAFNPAVVLPYGLTIQHIHRAMTDFAEFLGFINRQLHTRELPRFEMLLMPANFSSVVGEFMSTGIPKYCLTLAKNRYHNGHPDLIPVDQFPYNAAQHAEDGIEIKSSRYLAGWQGHNPENVWLMVFVFDSNRPVDAGSDVPPRPFRFVKVVGAQLIRDDWAFSGRSATSRRTITASVTQTGYRKLSANWIYQAPPLQGQG